MREIGALGWLGVALALTLTVELHLSQVQEAQAEAEAVATLVGALDLLEAEGREGGRLVLVPLEEEGWAVLLQVPRREGGWATHRLPDLPPSCRIGGVRFVGKAVLLQAGKQERFLLACTYGAFEVGYRPGRGGSAYPSLALP